MKEAITRLFSLISAHRVVLRVEGLGLSAAAPALRALCRAMAQHGYRRFLVDLSGCRHADSTFMGSLVWLSELGAVTVRCPDDKVFHQLDELGIPEVVRVERAAFPYPPELAWQAIALDAPAKGELQGAMREAHQRLAALSEANRLRFQGFLDLLDDPRQP